MTTLRLIPGASALVGLASACSGSTNVAAASEGLIVTVTTGSPPALVAFRDDLSTDWTGLPVKGATTFDLTTHGTYQVALACSSGDQDPSVTIIVYGRTPDDDPTIESSCGRGAPFHVRGLMRQAGEVALGGASEGTSVGNWVFDLPAQPGTFDLILLSRTAGVPSGIAFRRDVAVVNDKDLGVIDVTEEASQPLVPVLYTIANLQPGELATSTVLVTAGNTRTFVSSLGGPPPGLTAQLAPNSALGPTDSQRVTLSASITDAATSLSHSRALGRNVQIGNPTSWTLPDPLGPVTFELTDDQLTARWSTLPDHDEIQLVRESILFPPGPGSSVKIRLHEMKLSRSFVETTGATSATLDFHAIPGFKSDWRQDPSASQFRELVAIRHVSATETASATVAGFTSPSTARGELSDEPGAGRRATWFVPGQDDRWLTIPPRSPGPRVLAGRR
jgi:hypothetical protein